MAYREFQQQKYYEQPEVDFFPKTLALLQTAQQVKQRQQQQNRALAATWQADKLASSFTTDQNDLNNLSADVTNSAINDFRNFGYLSAATREKQNRALGYKQLSDAQWKKKEDLENFINTFTIKGPKAGANYYDKAKDQQTLIEMAYGNPNEVVNWGNREERLNQAAATLGKDYLNAFNKEAFLNDYVDELKTSIHNQDVKNQAGVKSGNKITAVFFDENGVPKVTGNHAIQFLDSSPDIRERYKQEVDMELLDDARKIAATKEGAWLKDLAPDQIIDAFRTNPALNTESKLKPGEREAELARKDLERKQRISLDNSYDAGDFSDQKSKGITSQKYSVGTSNFDPNSYGGQGGVFVSKDTKIPGIAIQVKGPAFDKNKNRVTGNPDSDRSMNVTSYNLGLVDQNGVPLNIPGATVDEQLAYVRSIPPEKLVNYSLRVLAHGQSLNDASLSNARKDLQALQLKEGKTDEEVNRMNTLRNALEQADINPDLAPEVIAKAIGAEIEDLVKVVTPGQNEENQISAKLGSFKMTDPKNWDADMRKFATEVNKIKNQKAIDLAGEITKPIGQPKEEKVKPKEEVKLKDSYIINGKTYTLAELKTMYSEERLKQAVIDGALK